MGFLEDLIKTVQEAVDESREQQQQQQPRRAPPAFPRRPTESMSTSGPTQDEAEATATRERLRRRYLEAQRQEAEAEAGRQHQRDHEAAVSVEAQPFKAGAAHAAAMAGTAPVLSQATGWWRVAQLLDDPRSLREAIILKEIIDKPLALRRRHPMR